MAHIDTTNGLFKELKKRTLEAFIQQESFSRALAVPKSGNIENYKQLCLLAEREIARVEGSGNAGDGISAIGKGRTSYLKLGDYSYKALKFSLIDHENRLRSKDLPKTKNSFIKSITFEGRLLDGEKNDFSPELNNIIGIRGSGKSSIIELLRYALNIPLVKPVADSDY